MSRTNRLGLSIGGAIAIALVASLAGVIWAGSLDPPNLPAPTQETWIYQPTTGCAGFPITLSAAGSYKLAQNISMPAACAKDGIDISASGATLDLNGFAVSGVVGSLNGVAVTASVVNISITNGTVVGWGGNGIDTSAGNSSMIIEHLRVSGNGATGIYAGNGAVIKDNSVFQNGASGIRFGWRALVDGNNVYVNAQTSAAAGVGGIVSASSGRGALVQNNAVAYTGNTRPGILLTGIYSARVVSNVSTDNEGAGIEVNGPLGGGHANVIEGNTVSRNSGGIVISSDSNIVTRNTAEQNFSPGNYSISAGNDVGPSGTAATATSPWANISD